MTAGPTPTVVAVRRPQRGSSPGWWTAATLVLLPALIPPLSLVWQVVTNGSGTSIPVARLIELLANTMLLTAAVTVTALAMGTGTAWLTSRSDLGGRRTWTVLAALPLVVPSYMAALTLIGATGPGGLLAEWFGITVPTPYGFFGAWMALSVFLAPMAHLIVTPALRRIDPATEEAATGLGAGRWKVFRTVTLPQLRPALVSAGLMVGLYTVSDFGAVSLLRFDTFTRAIFTLYAGQIDRRPAAALSVVLMVLALVILLVERRTRSRAAYQTGRTRRHRPSVPLRGWWRSGAYLYLGGYLTLALLVPLAVLSFWLVRGIGAGQDLGSIGDEVARSLGVSVAAAVIAGAASLPVAMVTTWKRGRASNTYDTATWMIYALPHITVGVAVVAFAPRLGADSLSDNRTARDHLRRHVPCAIGFVYPGLAAKTQPRPGGRLSRPGPGPGCNPGTDHSPSCPFRPPGRWSPRLPFCDEGATGDPAPPSQRIRNAGDPHLERNR